MNIGIIVNSKSGRNKASQFAIECEQLLKSRGHSTYTYSTTSGGSDDQLWGGERLIIIGGDGTVHHTLPELIEHQIPFYHLATGTANLIATEFNMPKDPAAAVNWIEQGGQTKIDVPTLDTVPFLVMCCLGTDAGVIHQFERRRKHSGGLRNYIKPVIHEIRRPRPAHITITVDDRELSIKAPLNLVIANMRSYAQSINPCPNADPTDSKLDVFAAPCSTTLGWTIQTFLNRCRLQIPNAQRFKASSITITGLNTPAVVQIDGEVATTPSIPHGILTPQQSIILQIGQHKVPVLTPPSR